MSIEFKKTEFVLLFSKRLSRIYKCMTKIYQNIVLSFGTKFYDYKYLKLISYKIEKMDEEKAEMESINEILQCNIMQS
jgi:hypothetical protein